MKEAWDMVAFTGHRPNKLGGYDPNSPLNLKIKEAIRKELKATHPVYKAISGMALGVDQWAAEICLELHIPFIAAVPFIGQEKAWPKQSQDKYNELISKADMVEIVCEGGYAAWKMQKRNEWMVDNSTILIAVWDGTDGGTANCFKYAEKKGKTIIRINPNDLKDTECQ